MSVAREPDAEQQFAEKIALLFAKAAASREG